jgi:hypothetical protein
MNNNNRLNLRIQLAGVQRQTERQETWQLANEFQFQKEYGLYSAGLFHISYSSILKDYKFLVYKN